jgi:hypothetical protein
MRPDGSGPYVAWSPVELSLSSDDPQSSPYTDVEVTAAFEHESGERHEIPGFWDGDRTWRVRFSPPRPGRWTFAVDGSADGLTAAGEFDVSAYAGDNPIREHGFLTVADGDRSLEHADGTPFFWLADTAWPAGAKATPEEWERYLDRRVAQGFNVVQVNTLPQWDASRPRGRYPFGEEWDLERPNPAYFRTLDALVAATHDRGVVPALVAIWRNYVAADREPTFPVTFSAEQAARYARYLGARYGAYGATWLVSGDSGLDEAALPVYDAAAVALRESLTHPLLTLHTVSSVTTTAAANETDWFDYHLYQSGHHLGDRQRDAYRYATDSRALDPARPVINGEPCYERHGYFEEPELRVSRAATRRAAWWSVLGGANAGLTYGAHGIWHWHREGDHVPHAEDRGMPEPWDRALSYPGADDYALLKSFVTRFEVGSLEPAQDVVPEASGDVRAAVLPADGCVLAYTPDARPLDVDSSSVPFEIDSVTWVNPGTGGRVPADLLDEAGPEVTVAAPPWEGDAVLWCGSE